VKSVRRELLDAQCARLDCALAVRLSRGVMWSLVWWVDGTEMNYPGKVISMRMNEQFRDA
jgi:hypothetical protein